MIATAAGPAWADFEAGVQAYDSGDYTTAYNEWLPLAAGGDPFAQRNLGHLYRLGLGVPQNFEVALNWYRRAAEQGLVRAEANLANMLLRGQGVNQSPREAAQWFHRAAVAGHAISQFNIGQMYRKGLAVPQDNAKALAWFELAADAGHDRSIELAAILSGEGIVPASEEEIVAPPFGETAVARPRQPVQSEAEETDDDLLADDEDDEDNPFASLLSDDDQAPPPSDDDNTAAVAEQDENADSLARDDPLEDDDEALLEEETDDLSSDGEDDLLAADNDDLLDDDDGEEAQIAALADEGDDSGIIGGESETSGAPVARPEALGETDDLIGGEEDTTATATVTSEDAGPASREEEAVVAARTPEPLTRRPRLSDDAMAAAVEEGLKAYQAKDFTAALRTWLPLAEAGNREAQFYVGGLYMDGTGVKEDRVRAHAWWQLSADQGHIRAKEFRDILRPILVSEGTLAEAEVLADELRAAIR